MESESESQSLADAAERRNTLVYERLQRLMDELQEPIRRAESLARLEAWLRLNPPRTSTSGGGLAS